MRELALIVIPMLAAAAALAWPREHSRPWLLPLAGVPHAAISLWLLAAPPPPAPGNWLAFDALARAVLPMISLLFLVCAFYAVAYLKLRAERKNRVFVATLLALLGLLSLAIQAQNLGLLWVAAEAATLVTVPMLHFNGTARALEAAWKYLLIGGAGVALSLLGSFCLGYASLMGGGGGAMNFSALAAQGALLSRPWLIAAWVLLLAGYGAKMGLAPMHTWKPDAYGEAPGLVGALFAGGTTTMAFTAILRVKQIVDAAGMGAMTGRTLLAGGLFSMLVAALFLLGTPDFKRMLAYSSVEQSGVLAVGAALGGAGLWAALFHVWTNGLTKGALFLCAGNLRRAAGARTVGEVAGMAWRTPVSARLFVAGILAVTALPPFGVFFSEMKILLAVFQSDNAVLPVGHALIAAAFLGCLLFGFLGMSRLAFGIVDGRPRAAARSTGQSMRETVGLVAPPFLFLAGSLWLGLATPGPLLDAWTGAVQLLSSRP